jgi:hypothetical protein
MENPPAATPGQRFVMLHSEMDNVLYRVGDYTRRSVNQEMPLTHY